MSTNTTSAAPSGGSGIAEAAEAWQDVLTPSRRKADPDTDDDQEPAPQGKKPTGKPPAAKAKAKEPAGDDDPDADDPDADSDADADTDPDADPDTDPDADEEHPGDDPEEPKDEESEDDPDGEADPDADADLTQTFTVTHGDGTEEDVTVEELVKGYYRQKDYTRKTQALAEERRATLTERQTASELRAQYARGLEQLQDAIKQVTPQEPDWDALKAADPIGYAETWADWQRQQVVVQQIEQEREAIKQQEQREFETNRKENAAKANEWLLTQVPEWKDQAKRQADRAGMKAYAMKLGFTAEELKNTDDPRAVLLIRQAWQFAKLQERKATTIKVKGKTPQTAGTKTPTLKPLAVKQPGNKQASQLSDAKKRHAKEKSVESAAGFFETLLTR